MTDHTYRVVPSWRRPGARVAECTCRWVSLPNSSDQAHRAGARHVAAHRFPEVLCRDCREPIAEQPRLFANGGAEGYCDPCIAAVMDEQEARR